jgi:hypothetical protein
MHRPRKFISLDEQNRRADAAKKSFPKCDETAPARALRGALEKLVAPCEFSPQSVRVKHRGVSSSTVSALSVTH